ncbi:MAG: type 1 glutamine amidotransferase [Proteobacteria bacterium]|nr:type 1 glutamine amidotransferase [Pseudomonadota bacterium]
MTNSQHIGILQTGHIGGYLGETYGEYPKMFMNLLEPGQFEYTTYDVVNGVFPESPNDCDGWVITGSKHGVYEDHPWIKPLEEFCRQLVASGRPTIGICFGHQIMAQALGGRAGKYAGGWGIGVREYVMTKSQETVHLLSFHQDQVLEAPKDTEIIMSSDFCKIGGLKYSPTCFSLQPHPEHTLAFMADLIKDRRGSKVPESVADEALAKLQQPNDQERFGNLMVDVLSGDKTL